MRPGDVIDGTQDEVEAALRGRPKGTVLSDCDGDVWENPSVEDVAQHRPLTVLRWGRELPKVDPPRDDLRTALVAVTFETTCRTLASLGVRVTDEMRGEILSSVLRATAPDAHGGAS